MAERLLAGPTVYGLPLSLARVLVRDLAKPRTPARVKPHLTTSALDVICDSRVSVVAECIGGLEPAGEYVESALRDGKHVVTANKALIAERGERLRAIARARGVELRYEAAVGGAIPILRTLRQLAEVDEIVEVGGVINGTTNFILSEMEEGVRLEAALRKAQRQGFAESDAGNDLDGIDAAHKLTILIASAFGVWPQWRSLARRGIRNIGFGELEHAKQNGWRLRLVACARKCEAHTDLKVRGYTQSGIAAVVTPAFVPEHHPFAAPRGVENVVRIVGRHTGPVVLSGLGAGRAATASAVLSDITDIAGWLAAGGRHVAPLIAAEPARDAVITQLALGASGAAYPIWEDRAGSETAEDAIATTGT